MRRAFNGLCMAIVQSTTQAGQIVLKASSPGLAAARVKIQAGRRALPPAVAVPQAARTARRKN